MSVEPRRAPPEGTALPQHAPLVGVFRGAVLESLHAGSVAVADAMGRLVAAVGDPETVTYLRSSLKPVQALTVVVSGAVDRFGITAEELAVIAASHSAEPEHQRAVRSVLAKAGLSVEQLRCGPHPPLHGPTASALARAGERPTPLHNNCSGKHAGMLAAARALGLPLETYLDPEHPVQERNRALLAELSGVAAAAIPVGVDGCGAPTFALPLRAMARLFARLAQPEHLPAPYREAAARVLAAMRQHPRLVAGTDRFDTALLERLGDRLVCKGGAEALHCAGLVETGLGVAVKIGDGGARAVAPAVLATLAGLGVAGEADLAALAAYARPRVENTQGRTVGELRPLFALAR